MGMIGYFAEIDSEKINQLLESTEKPLMDNIHDTLSGLRRLDIDKRWDFLHFGLTGTSAFDPAKNDPLSRAVLGEHSLEDGGNDSNLLIVFYVQIMPDDFVMQLHRF
nr:DUF1877 family protein [Escherichia coli]